MTDRAGSLLLTLAVACCGLAAALTLHLPLPFLFGPMLACLGAALLGARLSWIGQMTDGARSVIGVAIGASVTPAVLATLPAMALSLALVPAFVGLAALVGVPFFCRVMGVDRKTALLAAMPGGASDMVFYGRDVGADVRALSLIHATRVTVIVTTAPFLLAAWGADLNRPLGVALSQVPLIELALMGGAALAGWQGARALGLFGAPVLGPMIAAAALALGDLIHHRPPAEAMQAAQFVIGTALGAHYSGITGREITRAVGASVAFTLILALAAAAVAEGVVLAGLAPTAAAFLAFAPGGQAEMAVLAIVSGSEPGYVITHHILRLLVVFLGTPLLLRLAMRRG